MISEDSLLTIVFVLRSHSTGTVRGRYNRAAPRYRPGARERRRPSAQDRRSRANRPSPRPSAGRIQERDRAVEPLQLAHQDGAVRPRAGWRGDQLIAPGFGLEAGWSRRASPGRGRSNPGAQSGRLRPRGSGSSSNQVPLTSMPIAALPIASRRQHTAQAVLEERQDAMRGQGRAGDRGAAGDRARDGARIRRGGCRCRDQLARRRGRRRARRRGGPGRGAARAPGPSRCRAARCRHGDGRGG